MHLHEANDAKDQLSELVTTLGEEISHLATREGNESMLQLRATWSQLVTLLARGAASDWRVCPFCHHPWNDQSG
jgi:hypothetical protein